MVALKALPKKNSRISSFAKIKGVRVQHFTIICGVRCSTRSDCRLGNAPKIIENVRFHDQYPQRKVPIISTSLRNVFGAAIYDCGEYLVDAAKRLEICCFDYSGIVFRVAIRHSVEKLKSGSNVFLSVLHHMFVIKTNNFDYF